MAKIAIAAALLGGCWSTDRVLGEVSGQSTTSLTGGTAGAPAAAPTGGGAGEGAVPGTPQRSVNTSVWVSDLGELYVAGFVSDTEILSTGFVARVTPSGKVAEYAGPDASELYSISGCRDGWLLAAGQGVIARDGTWDLLDPVRENGVFRSVAARDCGDAIAVGKDGLAALLIGTTWTETPTPTTADLRDVAWLTPSEAIAVGTEGTLLHFDGAAWNAEGSPIAMDLRGVWAASSGRVLAVGGDASGRGVVLTREPAGWRLAQVVDTDNLYAVHGDGVRPPIAVGGSTAGDGGRSASFAEVDGAWIPLTVTVSGPLWDVWVPPHAYAVAVGADDALVRFIPLAAGAVAQLPPGKLTCPVGTTGLLAAPLLAELDCIDTTASLTVACVAPDVPATLAGARRCALHLATGLPFFTRAPAELLDAAVWGPCSVEPAHGACHSLRCDDAPPRHLCSPSAYCATVDCGVGPFDPLGCITPSCLTDQECDSGEHCVEVSLPGVDACFEDVDGDCTCSAEGGTNQRRCIGDG